MRAPSVLAPGLLLGLGLGGLADGILLHQVLQWHHVLSSTQDARVGVGGYPVDTVAGLEANTLWDGFFHVATWVLVVAGLAALWSRVVTSSGPFSRRSLLGAVLAGAGLFNLVEGIVDHHLLQVHHVRQATDVDNVVLWDVGFLAVGAALVGIGGVLYRRGQGHCGERDGGPATGEAPPAPSTGPGHRRAHQREEP